MDTKKVVPGVVLVVAGAAVLFWGATSGASVPQYGLAVAALALVVGTMLVGTSSVDQNRNV